MSNAINNVIPDASNIPYTSGGVSVEDAILELSSEKAEKTDIATVEPGTTASKPYSVGELVYVNGSLYRVKAATASGATFTEGTNIEVTNVSNELNNESADLLSLVNCEGWYTSRISKSGNIVNVQLSIHLTVSQSTGALIVASVPPAYKPVDPVVAFPKVNSSGQPSFGFLQKSDSRIYIYPTEANEYLTANFSYLAE